MGEMARLGSAGMDVHETASAHVPFEGFFERERDQLYRAIACAREPSLQPSSHPPP